MESSNFGNPKKTPKSIKQTIYDKIIDRYNQLVDDQKIRTELFDFNQDAKEFYIKLRKEINEERKEDFKNEIYDFVDYLYPIKKNLDTDPIQNIQEYFEKSNFINFDYFEFLDFVVISVCLQIQNFDLILLNSILKKFKHKYFTDICKEEIIKYLLTNKEQIDHEYLKYMISAKTEKSTNSEEESY
tara:strand:+ start:76 stop:633 length:558 start_codon:yes stop_codon:yes gene_type:complete